LGVALSYALWCPFQVFFPWNVLTSFTCHVYISCKRDMLNRLLGEWIARQLAWSIHTHLASCRNGTDTHTHMYLIYSELLQLFLSFSGKIA
jgi:hypothetical protein